MKIGQIEFLVALSMVMSPLSSAAAQSFVAAATGTSMASAAAVGVGAGDTEAEARTKAMQNCHNAAPGGAICTVAEFSIHGCVVATTGRVYRAGLAGKTYAAADTDYGRLIKSCLKAEVACNPPLMACTAELSERMYELPPTPHVAMLAIARFGNNVRSQLHSGTSYKVVWEDLLRECNGDGRGTCEVKVVVDKGCLHVALGNNIYTGAADWYWGHSTGEVINKCAKNNVLCTPPFQYTCVP